MSLVNLIRNTTTIILAEATCEKDLGVHVDNMLPFDKHILLTAKKARRSPQQLLQTIYTT